MTPKKQAEEIMRGIRDPEHFPPDRAVAFIEAIADALCKKWKDRSKHTETCETLLLALQEGRLALKAEPDALVLIDGRTGASRVRVPL